MRINSFFNFNSIPILTGTLHLVLTDTRTTCLTSATNRNALGSDVHPTRSQCPEIHACHTFHSNDSDELFVSMGQLVVHTLVPRNDHYLYV